MAAKNKIRMLAIFKVRTLKSTGTTSGCLEDALLIARKHVPGASTNVSLVMRRDPRELRGWTIIRFEWAMNMWIGPKLSFPEAGTQE